MSAIEKLALCITLLPAASCLMEDPGPEPDVAQHTRPLVTTDTCRNTPWGDLRVTVTAGTFGFIVSPCPLFNGDTVQFAVVAGAGEGGTTIGIEFLQNEAPVAKTLTGFQTHVGGRDEFPAGYRFEIVAACQEGATTFPDYRGRANKAVALAFRSRCTASHFSIHYRRQDNVGDLEHLAELTPIVYGAQPPQAGGGETPVTGDHFGLLNDSDPNLDRCQASGVVRTANITSLVTGAPVGTIELHRSRCTRFPSGAPVDIYFARARNDAGLWSGQIGSVYLKITNASGTFHNHKSTVTTPSTGTSLRSNVWVDDDPAALSVAACGTSYPTHTSKTSQATSSGCTTSFTLP